MHRQLLGLCLLAGAFVLAGCAQPDDGPTDPPAENGGIGENGDTVVISGNAFHPDGLEVPLGTTVIWTNDDDVDHTATADDESWDAGILAPGQSDGHSFNDEGEFPYHCAIHPDMTGTINVIR